MLNKVQIAGIVAAALLLLKAFLPDMPADDATTSAITNLVIALVGGGLVAGAGYARKESKAKLARLKTKD